VMLPVRSSMLSGMVPRGLLKSVRICGSNGKKTPRAEEEEDFSMATKRKEGPRKRTKYSSLLVRSEVYD